MQATFSAGARKYKPAPIFNCNIKGTICNMSVVPQESYLMSIEEQSSSSSLNTLEDVSVTNCSGPLHERSKTTRRQRDNNVRFSGSELIVETTHKNDMTVEEKNSTWLSYEEICAMKMDCVGLVGMLEDGMADMFLGDEEDLCLRGLEQHSGEGNQRRIAARRQILQGCL